MFGNINFKRFDRSSKVSGYDYTQQDNMKDFEYNPTTVSLENVGFNLHVSVSNYMAEAVMLGANVRSTPTKINSLLRDNVRTRHDLQNCVVVKIFSSENGLSPGTKNKVTQVRKTEIRIPGHMLNQGSVFIDELDCYLTTESNLEATRELIARDISYSDNQDTINLSSTLVQQEPTTLYFQYKHLVDLCIKRQDKINIRIGFDLRYGIAPDIIKNMHVAILDHYFVPFSYHKLVFDPTLDEDEFIIENLHLASREEFRYRFSELERLGVVYLDRDEQNTLFGKYYRMALFSNEALYLNYVYQRKATERFNDETIFLAERSGDPRLKEQIVTLSRDLDSAKLLLDERQGEIDSLRSTNKRLVGDLKDRESTITKIQARHDAHMSAEVVLRGLDNEASKISNDGLKHQNDRRDQMFRETSSVMIHKATMLKTMGDILKSGWGIATACLGGVFTVAALLKKHNVRITMS